MEFAHGLPECLAERTESARFENETAPSLCEARYLERKGTAMGGNQPQRNVGQARFAEWVPAAFTCGASSISRPWQPAGFSASEVSMAYSLFLLTTCFSSSAGWLAAVPHPASIYRVVCSGVLFEWGLVSIRLCQQFGNASSSLADLRVRAMAFCSQHYRCRCDEVAPPDKRDFAMV